MTAFDLMVVGGPLLIIVADLVIYLLVGRLGKRSSGKGVKYQPFTVANKKSPPGAHTALNYSCTQPYS